MPALTISYIGKAGSWTGVVKLDGRILAECGHAHSARDNGYQGSAVSCAWLLLYAARRVDLEGGPHCVLRGLHATAERCRATMLRRGLREAHIDEAIAALHAHIDEAVVELRAAIEAGATVPSRY